MSCIVSPLRWVPLLLLVLDVEGPLLTLFCTKCTAFFDYTTIVDIYTYYFYVLLDLPSDLEREFLGSGTSVYQPLRGQNYLSDKYSYTACYPPLCSGSNLLLSPAPPDAR